MTDLEKSSLSQLHKETAEEALLKALEFLKEGNFEKALNFADHARRALTGLHVDGLRQQADALMKPDKSRGGSP